MGLLGVPRESEAGGNEAPPSQFMLWLSQNAARPTSLALAFLLGLGAAMLMLREAHDAFVVPSQDEVDSLRKDASDARMKSLLQGLEIDSLKKKLASANSESDHERVELTELRTRAETAEAKVAALEKAAAEAAKATPETTPAGTASAGTGETAPPTPQDKEAALARLAEQFKKVAKLGLAGVHGEKANKLAEAAKELGADAINMLAERLTKGEDTATRFLAAALFEELADPAAAPSLVEALQNDPDALVRRMSSHALAVAQMEKGYDALERAMIADTDWGVRVNSAYGLAKNGRPQGLDALVNAYESPDTPGEYRISILGGIADVAAPSTAPLFRKILAEKDDLAYLYMAINTLEAMKDRGSLDALANLIVHAKEDSVKEAAKRAYNTIVGQEIYK